MSGPKNSKVDGNTTSEEEDDVKSTSNDMVDNKDNKFDEGTTHFETVVPKNKIVNQE